MTSLWWRRGNLVYSSVAAGGQAAHGGRRTHATDMMISGVVTMARVRDVTSRVTS